MKIKKLNNMNMARRDFIKGLASVGVLSSLSVEKLFAQTSAPLRVMFVALQHGWGSGGSALDDFKGSEFDFELPAYFAPFEAIKDQIVFIDGLRGTFWGNAHDVSYADMLTASVPIKAPVSAKLDGPFPLPTNESIDNYLARLSGKDALRLNASYRSFGAAYNPLSFNDGLERLPYYTRPIDAYNAFFRDNNGGGGTPTTVPPETTELFQHLSAEANRIVQQVKETERGKLLSYLDSIQAIERRYGQVPTTAGTAELNLIPQGGQTSIGQSIDEYLDMVRVAFTNDTHRVAVVGFGDNNNDFEWTDSSGAQRTGYSSFGDFHHEVAHFDGKTEDAQRAYIAWTAYYANKVTNFVQQLEQTTDVDGSPLIDNTIIVLTGEVGNGVHDRRHKPHIVIGGGSRINRGRWLRTPNINGTEIGSRRPDGSYTNIDNVWGYGSGEHSRFSHADLFVTIARMAGSNINEFGIDLMNYQPLEL